MEISKQDIEFLEVGLDTTSRQLLDYYENLETEIKRLTECKEIIRDKIEKYLELHGHKEIQLENISGQKFSIKIVETKRESFDKDQVKFYITPDQYKECLKTSSSSSLKITKLKGEK